jgi:hypothetical protein
MADVNFSGISTPLGRFLTVTGFGSVQSLVGVRQTPVLGSAQVADATVTAVPTTGIIATFNDAAGAAAGANTQEILNIPSNWRGYVTGLEIGIPNTNDAGAAGAMSDFKVSEALAYMYIRVTCGGIDTDVPLVSCYRYQSANDGNTAQAAGSSAGRNPYFFSSPLFWAGDGSETVRLMAQQNSPAFAAPGGLTYDFGLTLHVALGRSQDNSEVQPGFGGPTNCPSGDEYLAATQLAAGLRRSVSG